MAITMDGNPITSLLLKASNGTSVTKQLVETGGVSVDDWDIYNKELIDTWDGELNLSEDTNFNSLTPSTSVQYIIANDEPEKTIAVDLTNYRYLILREEYIKAAYTGTPADKSFAKRVSLCATFLFRSVNDMNVYGRLGSNISFPAMTYQYNTNGNVVAAPNGQQYGIYEYESHDTPTYVSTSNASTNVTIGMPRWTMRGSQSYSPVATLEAIDSANSTIEYRYRLYRMPVNTLFTEAADEAKYIVENDGLRTLPSND